MDLVSIVVPIYNCETYLTRCISSILNQTYANIQLVIVNDGSTDNSYLLCKELAATDNRIELFSQENKGVSAARNKGLLQCKGKYVFFVDADDYILPEYIEHFMLFSDAPFIGGGYTDSNGWTNQYEDVELPTNEYWKLYAEALRIIPSVHVTGNRYLLEVINSNSLKFDEDVNCGEDARFNAQFFSHTDRLIATKNCEYMYSTYSNSLINRFIQNRLQFERDECKLRQSLFIPSKEFGSIIYLHWNTTLEHYYAYLNVPSYEKDAKRMLRSTVWDSYFRKGISYMLRYGTLDMKIEGICLLIGIFKLYKLLLRFIS